ncbi:predicted protein, partial [Haematococcus lacustris]
MALSCSQLRARAVSNFGERRAAWPRTRLSTRPARSLATAALLEAGADKEARDKAGLTALQVSLLAGWQNISELPQHCALQQQLLSLYSSDKQQQGQPTNRLPGYRLPLPPGLQAATGQPD